MNDVYTTFQHPDATYRGKPFWAWNGVLERSELRRQIQVFKQMGFGGFFMHSRTGLVTEYLGDDWFSMVGDCVHEAKRLGMEAWLYDEDRWPSGTAGGFVTQIPEFRARHLYMQVYPKTAWADLQGALGEGVTATFACHLEGLDYEEFEPYLVGSGEPPGDRHNAILVVSVEEMQPEAFYNGQTYVDTMNRNATNLFLERTHELYAKRYGDEFGRTVKGIFTDEPHRGSLMDGFGLKNPDGGWRLPFTEHLFEEFQKRYGYDLLLCLPALFLRNANQIVSQVKWHYVELLQQLFLENYLIPLNEWCDRHGLVLTGHGLHEDSMSSQTAMTGSLMRLYEYMGQPGIDILTEGNRCYWVAKQISSVGRQLSKPWRLSELYGCTGWQFDFAGHKAVGDWQALFGINVRCHHLSFYTMAGEAKRDYPASISDQSAWWPYYKDVETYFARLQFLLSQGDPVCQVLVVHPIESVWCQVHAGWSHGLSAQSEPIQRLEEDFQNVFHWLSESLIDFDYGDEDIVARHGAIESCDDHGRPHCRIGQAVYQTIVVAGLVTIRSSTVALLEQFVEAGGHVVFAGAAPRYVDAVPSLRAMSLAERTQSVPLTREALTAACQTASSTRVRAVVGDEQATVSDLFCQTRRQGSDYTVVLLNVNRSEGKRGVRLYFPWTGRVECWDCLTGDRVEVPVCRNDDGCFVVADFAPGGERVFRILNDVDDAVALAKGPCAEVVHCLEGPFRYRLSEANVCVLDLARYRWQGGDWEPGSEVLQIDRTIRRLCSLPLRAGDMIQPWCTPRDHTTVFGQLELEFEFFVDTIPQGPISLAMENPESFQCCLNGHAVTAAAFSGRWVDICFKVAPISLTWLRQGVNRLTLSTEFCESVELESLYLLGDFGVHVADTDKTLIALPGALSACNVAEQGLPFYSGEIVYELPATIVGDDAHAPSGASVRLSLPDFGGACAVVATADGTFQKVLPWPPYETKIPIAPGGACALEIRVVLTRRNTFGPLHLYPARSPHYGPEHFVTTGEQYRDSYQLVPSGLLECPKVIVST